MDRTRVVYMIYFRKGRLRKFRTKARLVNSDTWRLEKRLPVCGFDRFYEAEIGYPWMCSVDIPYVLSWEDDVEAARELFVQSLAMQATTYKNAAFRALDLAYEVRHAKVSR